MYWSRFIIYNKEHLLGPKGMVGPSGVITYYIVLKTVSTRWVEASGWSSFEDNLKQMLR